MRTALPRAAFLLLAVLAAVATAAEPVVAIVGATVLVSPTDKPIPNGVVLLQAGRVLSVGTAQEVPVPAKATRIDGKGLTLSAGYWNCHVHFSGPEWQEAKTAPKEKLAASMEEMLNRYGFTTVAQSAGSGNAALSVPFSVTSLQPGTTYYYRLDAQNSNGLILGSGQSFTTSAPRIPTRSPSLTAPRDGARSRRPTNNANGWSSKASSARMPRFRPG